MAETNFQPSKEVNLVIGTEATLGTNTAADGRDVRQFTRILAKRPERRRSLGRGASRQG